MATEKEPKRSQEGKITELLNQAGVPFQEFCHGVVQENPNCKSIQEVPFTHPPSHGVQLGKTGAIDILAAKFQGLEHFGVKGLIYLFVECKKADPSIKNWVFTRVQEDDKRLPRFFLRKRDTRTQSEYYRDLESVRGGMFAPLGYGNADAFESVKIGVELNDALTSWNRTADNKIYKAALQANHGLNAIGSRLSHLVQDLDVPPPRHILYLPVVVTTANLYIAHYDAKKVSPNDGSIDPKEVEYTEKPWLTYDFPLPDYLTYTNIFRDVKDKYAEHASTFIVNSKHWKNFLEKVDFFHEKLRD